MKKLKKMCTKSRNAEKGFTLIELLIVIAILGILAAVIIPNVTGFVLSGNIGAANNEVAAVHTAIQGYMADNPTASGNITSDTLSAFFPTGTTPKAVYTYATDSGLITAVTDVSATVKWPAGMQFSTASQTWIKSVATPTGRLVP